MAVQPAPSTQVPADHETYGADDERGYGWVAFAGTLLLIVGTLNFIEGLAAIGNSHFFANNTHYIVGNLKTWGWIVLFIGVIEWLVGVGVFVKNQFSRWVGVVVLSLNSLAQLLMIPAYPFWSLRSSRSTSWRSTGSLLTATGSPPQTERALSHRH